MKAYTILILIAASLAVSTLLYRSKWKQTDPIDSFSKSLQPVITRIPPGAHISIRTEPSKAELLPWARYTLAPRYLSPLPDFDTTLTIQYLQGGDSSLQAFVAAQHLIWQAQDSQYVYTLTTNPDEGH